MLIALVSNTICGKLKCAPQKFSRASRAPLSIVSYSCGTVEPTPSSPKFCIRPCNEIRNSDRKAACVLVCVCVGEGGGGSLCICPPSDRQATSPLVARTFVRAQNCAIVSMFNSRDFRLDPSARPRLLYANLRSDCAACATIYRMYHLLTAVTLIERVEIRPSAPKF